MSQLPPGFVLDAPPAQQRPDPVIATDPFKVEDQQIQRDNAARADEDQRMQREKFDFERQQREKELAAGVGADARESEAKAAAFLIRALGSNKSYEAQGLGARGLVGQKFRDIAPNVQNSLPEFIGNSPERQIADSSQDEFIAASLRQDSGAAIPPEEMERQRRIYFPMPGDGPEVLEQKKQARARAIEGLKQSAGVLADSAIQRWEAMAAEQGVTGGGQGGDAANPWPGVVGQDGKPLPPEGGYGLNPKTGEWEMFSRSTDDTPRTAEDDPELAKIIALEGEPGLSTIGQHGISFGLSDEAAGVGGFLSAFLTGKDPVAEYERNNALQDRLIERARGNNNPATAALTEIAGAGGAARFAGNALLSVGKAAKAGGGLGALGGFGYGEGAEGSFTNALAGAAGGAALGAGGQYVGNALINRAAGNATRATKAADLQRAGQAEGVTVNRAMVDPALANRVSGVDATLAGGPRVQRGMSQIEGQIEGRVQNLGRGGQPMDEIAAGDRVRTAAERTIEKTGKSAKRKYDRAERLAGDAKVEPKEALRRVDEMIASLGETGASNSAEIAFLQGIKSDLSKDLSVGALRRMRTKLRKQISKGELTFGEDEARVLSIMDGAADDIRAGLTAQGKGEAASAFDAADKSYRARMEYINGTIQKLIGKRNATLSAEQVARKFESMAGNDARGLRKFYASLDPDEAADVAATFAQQFGNNNKGEFSVAHFLRQSEKLSDEALRTMFGAEGAQSVRNLRELGREVNRVTSAMNSRTSKTGVANNYRDWLYNLMLGGIAGGGGAVTSGSGAAVAGATAAVGANAARSYLSARSLMSPNLTKWLRQAPRTTSAKAIDSHFARLGAIAKAEPALAEEITVLREGLMRAANDNVGVGAAAGDRKEDQKKQ